MAQFVDEKYQMFKSQNTEESFFDVTFDVEGKHIHAHKFMLASVSEVLKRMVSDTWNNGETIKIKAYSFNDFYEFLTFLYSGNCKLNDENIFTMVDLSEFYQVKSLKYKCDEYLYQKEYTNENLLIYLEALSNYSLPLFEKHISESMKNLNSIESESFLRVAKEVILKIVKFEDRIASEEKLFEKIYEWAEKQAKKKQIESNEEDSHDAKQTEDDVPGNKEKGTQTFDFNMNDAIKAELIEILPFLRLKEMKLDFLIDFVVKKGFLFSYKELSEILNAAKANEAFVKVKITNEYGKSIICMLPKNSDISENIKSLKYHPCDFSATQFAFWNETKIKIPLIPSQIKKRDGIEWYLFYNNGGIGVINHSIVTSEYLLAEMIPEASFVEITEDCKIEIV